MQRLFKYFSSFVACTIIVWTPTEILLADREELKWTPGPEMTERGIVKKFMMDACELTIFNPLPDGATVRIADFSANPQTPYTASVNVAFSEPRPPSVSLIVRWLGEEGKDTAEIEKGLGMKNSTLISTKSSINGTLTVSGISTPRAQVRRGVLELRIEPLPKGRIVVSKIRVQKGLEEQDEKPLPNTALIINADPSYDFQPNLMINPSFEEGSESITGWHYEGPNPPSRKSGGYAGRRGIILESEKDRWVSDAAKIQSGVPLWMLFWTRFNKNAEPRGHPYPVVLEFLQKNNDGRMIPIPLAPNRDFAFNPVYTPFFGMWFPVMMGPITPPAGATQVRAVIQYTGQIKGWGSQPFMANWGRVEIDNVALWQTPGEKPKDFVLDAVWRATTDRKDVPLPPFLPVGNRREHSLMVIPMETADANIFISDAAETKKIETQIRNLLSIKRNIELEATVLDWEGQAISVSKNNIDIAPYGVAQVAIPIDRLKAFGAYSVELHAMDGKITCGEAIAHFAWLKPPLLSNEERHRADYPFDMHPMLINADSQTLADSGKLRSLFTFMKRLGVGAIRLQSRYDGLNLKDAAASGAAARRKVDNWRNTVLPLMQEYGIKGWVSLMEQAAGCSPKSAEDFKAWHEYHRAMAEAFGDDVEFYLFGNEGIGHHTPADLDKDCWPISSYAGSTRDWMHAYMAAREAVKEANPRAIFGPAHASDPEAVIVNRFYDTLGSEAKFDIWGFNTYGNTPSMAKTIFDTIKEYGGSPKFGVIPETGISGATPSSGQKRVQLERRQAIGLVQTYLTTLARAPWIKHIAWFILQASSGGNDGLQISDLGGPYPAAAAYLMMTHRLGAGEVQRTISVPGGGEFIVWRKASGSVVGVGWAQSEQLLTLDCDASELALEDLFGNRQMMKTSDGTAVITLSESPCFVLGADRLDRSQRFQASATNGTHSAKGPCVVNLKIVNNGDKPTELTVTAKSHGTLAVEPSTITLTAGTKETVSKDFEVTFLQRNDRIRTPLQFQASTPSGSGCAIKFSDTFARCVRAPANFRMDGTWTGWKSTEILHADQRTQAEEMMGRTWGGPDDISGQILTMWDDHFLYIGVRVHDDVFCAQQPPQAMFLNDAIEIGLDLEHRLSSNSKPWQFVVGKSLEGNTMFRHLPGPAKRVALDKSNVLVEATEQGGDISYQVAIPWTELDNFKPAAGKQIGFGLIVDDSDGKPNDRKFISWFGGGISSKRPQELGDLIFVK